MHSIRLWTASGVLSVLAIRRVYSDERQWMHVRCGTGSQPCLNRHMQAGVGGAASGRPPYPDEHSHCQRSASALSDNSLSSSEKLIAKQTNSGALPLFVANFNEVIPQF